MELLISCELKKPVEDMRLRDSKVSVYQGQSGADIHLSLHQYAVHIGHGSRLKL